MKRLLLIFAIIGMVATTFANPGGEEDKKGTKKESAKCCQKGAETKKCCKNGSTETKACTEEQKKSCAKTQATGAKKCGTESKTTETTTKK